MKISMVTPTHNRARLLVNSIESVMRQQRKPDEWIIIDDGSSDNTRQVIETFQVKYPGLIRYIYRDSPLWVNPSVPLNIGIKMAQFELIVFSLSDMVHIGETLSYIEKRHENQDMMYLIGAKIFWVQKDVQILSDMWQNPNQILLLPCVRYWTPGYIAQDNEIVCMTDMHTSNLASCRKKYLMEVNGFDEKMTQFYGYEDSDITQRLYNFGKPSINAVESDFLIERDNNVMGIHQYHERPPAYAMVGVNQHFSIAKNNMLKIKVNEDIEWGKL